VDQVKVSDVHAQLHGGRADQVWQAAEAVAIATEMKAYTKATAGSSWAIDRRTI
jgi:hypothetical protein